jgi:hypothetical protein
MKVCAAGPVGTSSCANTLGVPQAKQGANIIIVKGRSVGAIVISFRGISEDMTLEPALRDMDWSFLG